MANYACKKCGLTGFSKNIRGRNLFTNDMLASVLTNIANVTTETSDRYNGRRVVTLEFPYMDDGTMADDELEMQAIKNLQGLSDETISHWLCNHKWEHVSGEEIEI